MLDDIKNYLMFNYVDKCIGDRNYDLALEKLNYLVEQEFKPAETMFKRAMLCRKLLMSEDAYADFTYIIENFADKQRAYYERMKLNFEISNFYEAISDANQILNDIPDNTECKTYKILSYIYAGQPDLAKSLTLDMFDQNMYKALQFLFNETAKNIASDQLARALKVLDIIELIDENNPIKIFKESNIYGLAGDKEKENELLQKLDTVFGRYFISHFKFTDMYEERDLLETCFLLELRIFDKQKNFEYQMNILDGYRAHLEGRITDSKEAFEKAIELEPKKPEGYVLLGQTLQLMSGYDNPAYRLDAEANYKKAMAIYQKENLTAKTEDMIRQIKHLNSTLSLH